MLTVEDLTRRRRMVAHALREHLPGPVVLAAVRLCDDEFSRDPAFSLVKFLDRLTAADGSVAAVRPTLFVSLQKARMLSPDALGADPLPKRARAAPAPPPAPARAAADAPPPPRAAPAAGGWDGVFNALLESLMSSLRRHHFALPAQALGHLSAEADGLGLSPAAGQELNAWLKSGAPSFTPRTTRREMHLVVHAFYLWACEALGPVGTDRLLTAAVREAEAHPAATRHPPQSLL